MCVCVPSDAAPTAIQYIAGMQSNVGLVLGFRIYGLGVELQVLGAEEIGCIDPGQRRRRHAQQPKQPETLKQAIRTVT